VHIAVRHHFLDESVATGFDVARTTRGARAIELAFSPCRRAKPRNPVLVTGIREIVSGGTKVSTRVLSSSTSTPPTVLTMMISVWSSQPRHPRHKGQGHD
jgi:hypothetical protein